MGGLGVAALDQSWPSWELPSALQGGCSSCIVYPLKHWRRMTQKCPGESRVTLDSVSDSHWSLGWSVERCSPGPLLHTARIYGGNCVVTATMLSAWQTAIGGLVRHTPVAVCFPCGAGCGGSLDGEGSWERWPQPGVRPAVCRDFTVAWQRWEHFGGSRVTLRSLTCPLLCPGALCTSLEQDCRLPWLQRPA